MARPRCCRRIGGEPGCRVFQPSGVPASSLDEVVLSIDEFEAIRLADFEGLYHEQAAEQMNVSRQTFGRIIEAARSRIAKVLVEGLALRIEGGGGESAEKRTFKCDECQHTWDVPFGTGRPAGCPACRGKSIFCSEERRGTGEGDGGCPRRRCRRSL